MKKAHLACGFAVLLLGCGDDSAAVGGSGAGSAGGPNGGSSTGGAPSGGAPSGGAPTGGSGGEAVGGSGGAGGSDIGGDCDTNADCPGGTCIELHPGSYRVCQYPVVEATSCGSKSDICCSSLDCEGVGETCLVTPITAFCAGVQQKPHNECASDQCATDGDCGANEICAPKGTLGNQIRVCLTATCEGQCAGGVPCAVIRNPCCGAPLGLFCAPGCLVDADCPDGYCDIDPETQESICVDGSPICPA